MTSLFRVHKVGGFLTLVYNGSCLSKDEFWLLDSPSNRVKLYREGLRLSKNYFELRDLGLLSR